MTHHWHVATGLAGYGPDASDGNWTTIDESDATGLADAIREELQSLAGFENEGADALADSGDYKSAWEAMKNAESMLNLAASFDNKRAQAPLYVGNPALWHQTIYRLVEKSFPLDFRDAMVAADRLYVWECSETGCHDEEEGRTLMSIKITEAHLEGLRAWASTLEASLRNDDRTDRIRDNAHDLVMCVRSLLEDNGRDLANGVEEADKALTAYLTTW